MLLEPSTVGPAHSTPWLDDPVRTGDTQQGGNCRRFVTCCPPPPGPPLEFWSSLNVRTKGRTSRSVVTVDLDYLSMNQSSSTRISHCSTASSNWPLRVAEPSDRFVGRQHVRRVSDLDRTSSRGSRGVRQGPTRTTLIVSSKMPAASFVVGPVRQKAPFTTFSRQSPQRRIQRQRMHGRIGCTT
jgi:hypothetical protein